MGEFLEKYGGVIVAVIAIVALIAVVKLVFTDNTESGIGGSIKDAIGELTTEGGLGTE